MLRLVCEYYLLLVSIAHEMQQFERSIALASWVITLAEMNKLYDHLGYALLRRGFAQTSRGELTAGLVNFAAARDDFEAAVHDFEAIKQIETHLSPQSTGLMWGTASWAYAHVAQDQASLSQALKLVDLGEKMIGKDSHDLVITIKFDQSRVLLNRGMTLINSPIPALRSPAKARAAFEQAMRFTPPTNKRRHLEGSLRQAEAYFHEGAYEMAVAYAGQALELVRDTDVLEDMTRLHNLYVRLRESPFGENGDVVRFGVDLLKVQKADLFH
jgi:tetratricopeptide (TPR) repeat protein